MLKNEPVTRPGATHKKPLFKDGVGSFIFDVVIYVALIFLLIITLYPFLNIIATSFNDALDSLMGGIYIWPRKFTLYNYQQLFRDAQIYHATLISALRAIVGTVVTTSSCMMVAYTLSRKEYILRMFIMRAFIFTMYFSGGLIPYYLLMKSLNLVGTFWVYIFPSITSAWNIMVMRSYINNSIPDSLIESARIDGASEFRTLTQIVVPLSVPIIATVMLWCAVGQWNSWFDVYLYNNTKPELSTLQFELQKLLQRTMTTSSQSSYSAGASAQHQSGTITPQSTRAAMTVVATVPILCVYPFLQKYFIHGLTLGGIKG